MEGAVHSCNEFFYVGGSFWRSDEGEVKEGKVH
jgi:hypothetical protein